MTQPDPDMPVIEQPVLHHFDVFPASVAIEFDDQIEPIQLSKVRVRTDGPTVEVWAESRTYPHQPELVYSATVNDEVDNTINARYPISQQHATLVTHDAMVAVRKSNGCGCGSRLYNIPQTRYQQQAENSQLMNALRNHFPDANF